MWCFFTGVCLAGVEVTFAGVNVTLTDVLKCLTVTIIDVLREYVIRLM